MRLTPTYLRVLGNDFRVTGGFGIDHNSQEPGGPTDAWCWLISLGAEVSCFLYWLEGGNDQNTCMKN